jgi:hypothetical protein
MLMALLRVDGTRRSSKNSATPMSSVAAICPVVL